MHSSDTPSSSGGTSTRTFRYPALANIGERAGKYLLLIELESAERRDRIYPSEGVIAEDVQQLVGNLDPLWAKLSTLVVDFPDPKYTDYVIVSD